MRCYCSICRKTAGGGGYAINIMGKADTLQVKGAKHIKIYHAKIKDNDHLTISAGERHFCKHCGSCLWVFDPSWPELIHPFASAIDTPLPKAPHETYIMLNYAAPWCKISKNKQNKYFMEYPDESIEEWHKRLNLYEDT